MKNKQFTADQIIRFFKAFKISIPLAFLLFIILFFGVFQGYKTISPDLSYITNISQNGEFQEIVWKYRDKYNDLSVHYSIDRHKQFIMYAIKDYQIEKIWESTLYSLIILLGLPLMFIFKYWISKVFGETKKWVDENKSFNA